MNDETIDRLTHANPVPHADARPGDVDDLLAEVHASPTGVRPRRAGATARIAVLAAVLVLGASGAAVAMSGVLDNSDPNSPDDPPITLPRGTTPDVQPLSGADVRRLKRERLASEPILDAGDHFAALKGVSQDTFTTLYRRGDGFVSARPSDREICFRFGEHEDAGWTGSCVATAIAQTRGAFGFAQCEPGAAHPQHRLVAGIAPDGVDQVSGERDGVAEATTPVVHNAFVLTTDQPIDTVDIGGVRARIGPVAC